MSLDGPQENVQGFSDSGSCIVDKMPQTTKNEMDEKSECEQEQSLLSSEEALTVTQPAATEVRCKENCELKSTEQINMAFLKNSLKTNFNIEKEVKMAVESGNIEEYCKDLATRLTEWAQSTGTKVAERIFTVKEKAFAVVREESNRKKQWKKKDVSSGQKSFEAKLEPLSEVSKDLVLQAMACPDPVFYCNSLGNEISKIVQSLQEQAAREAQELATQVSEAAKALQESANLQSSKISEDEEDIEMEAVEEDFVNSENNTSNSRKDEDEMTCDSKIVEEDLSCSESDTSSSPVVEDETFLETEDDELVRNESNTTCSQTNEDDTTMESKNDEKDLEMSESDEDSEKAPITEQDDEHVIPTPPPPPPVHPVYNANAYRIQEDIRELKRYQVNQIGKELNFAIARLTSEVIKSYEQACILQKHGAPSLKKSTLDFLEKQETKKTFYIKEISTRVHQVLRMLSPETETNAGLQDLDETVKLLYLLQTTRNYYVDKITVTTFTNAKIGYMFNFLLPLAFFVIVLTLILNGEWVGLIIFVAVVLICLIKAWQGMVNRKRVEVFGRIKKKAAAKVD